MTTTNRSAENTALRLAAADVLGQRCAIEMIEACPLDVTDASGAYLTNVADPLPGDYEALSAKLLDPTDEERAAFVRGYREQIETQIRESGRDD